MNQSLLRFFLKRTSNSDEECDCQPAWLALALAVLPVLIDKIGNFLMHYLFGEDEEEEVPEEKPKKKKNRKSKRVEET
jgi:hypothetical protein